MGIEVASIKVLFSWSELSSLNIALNYLLALGIDIASSKVKGLIGKLITGFNLSSLYARVARVKLLYTLGALLRTTFTLIRRVSSLVAGDIGFLTIKT